MQRYAVIVDPVSTAQEYPAAFRAMGVESIAVLSTTVMPEVFRPAWHPENFAHTYVFDGDLDALIKGLAEHDVLCVIPGTDTGIVLCDALADALVPGTGNVGALTLARRDKWHMALALREAGVACLRQIATDDPEHVVSWLATEGLEGRRLVLKPPRSGGADDVQLVSEGDDWRPVFHGILGQINKNGLRNDTVVVQEFAEGTEYLIDSYTVDGRHGLVDVCRYTKLRRGDQIGIYDLVDFLPPDHPEVLAVWPYTQQVLDAVGVRNGCGHTEVILTPDGPRMLEIAARPAGGGHQMITKLATGSNHIMRTVEHRVRGDFQPSYELIKHVCSVVVNSPSAGIWANAEIFADVDSLTTFYAKQFKYGTGDLVPVTEDIYTFLGWVVLASPDADAVTADYRRIKDLERQIRIDPDSHRPVELATAPAPGG